MTHRTNKRRLLVGFLVAVALCVVVAFMFGIVAGSPGHVAIATPAGNEQGAHGLDKGERDLEPLHASESVTRHIEDARNEHKDVEVPITKLSVQVCWEDGNAAAAINVGVGGLEDAAWAFKRAATDATGMATFQPRPGSILVIVDRAPSQVIQVAEGESKALKITIPGGNDVKGSVVTRDGDPVRGARVLLYDPESALSPCVVANSDSAGEFAIRSVRLGMTELCAEAPSFSPSPRVRLKSQSPGYTHTVQLVVGAPGGSLAVRVTTRKGNTVEGALVTVGDWPPEDDAVVRADGTEIAPYLPRGVLTDKEGKALAENLAAGPQAIRVQSLGFGYYTSEVNVLSASRIRSRVGRVMRLKVRPWRAHS